MGNIGDKKRLYEKCTSVIERQIAEIQLAINSAKESAADDTKSSAGDKYETGREMMQQSVNRLGGQLFEAGKIRQGLINVNPEVECSIAKSGALLTTNNGLFYIAVGLGKLELDGTEYFVISPASPLALKMAGLGKGSEFDFNHRTYNILDII